MDARRLDWFGLVLWSVVKLMYLSALTALIPFGAFFLTAFPRQGALQAIPAAALGLVVICIIILLAHYRSFARTLAALGWMTLIPGVGALLFHFFQRERLVVMLTGFITSWNEKYPQLASLIEESLPKIWLFIIGYIVLGVVMLYVAGKLEHQHALTSTLRKMFGPRARIFRQH